MYDRFGESGLKYVDEKSKAGANGVKNIPFEQIEREIGEDMDRKQLAWYLNNVSAKSYTQMSFGKDAKVFSFSKF